MRQSNNVLNRILMLGFLVAVMGTTVMAETMAYWRFDDQGDAEIAANIGDGAGGTVADGGHVPDSDGQTIWRKAAHDHSGNGNHLTTWEWEWAGFNWSSDVGAPVVKGLGLPNALSIANGGTYPAAMTWSEQSNPTGVDLETWQPLEWTIEVSFETNYSDGARCIVGRDDRYIYHDSGSWMKDLPSMFFCVRDGKISIEFMDNAGNWHVAAGGAIATNTWYNAAATCDGETLKVYLNNLLVGSTDISWSTDSKFALGSYVDPDFESGTWTVGRGGWAGGHVDRFYGHIDEVRISDESLEMPDFLYGGYEPVSIDERAIPDDLYSPFLPFGGTVGYDSDQDPPIGSTDGGSVWGSGAFYSDVQGSAAGGPRDYTSLRIHLADLIKRRDVRLAQIDSISYYTNMQPGSPIDWQLKIYTYPLAGQASGWYGHRLNFVRGTSDDGNWDLWDTDTYNVEWVRSGDGVESYYPDVTLDTLLASSPYGTEKINFIDIIAGYATSSPPVDSYLDAVTITLTDGSEIKLDLEASREPVCSTHAALNITATSATLAGAVVDDGGLECEIRFVYTPEGGAAVSTPWKAFASRSAFLNVEGLLDDTTYTYYMEIRNASATYSGYPRSFTTLQLPQVLLSSSAGGSVAEPGEGLVKLVNQGDILDVNAVAQEGYLFSQWAGTAVDQGLVADPMAAVTSVEVYQALTLKALFVPEPKIVWVTEDRDADEDGVRDDVAWVEMLEAAGYVVDCQPDRYVDLTGSDPNDANDYMGELNAATLVIISRTASSGNYDDGNEIALWNSITTPTICLSAYHIRNSRWDWLNSGSQVSDNLLNIMPVEDANHPIFAGVSLTDGSVIMSDYSQYPTSPGTTFVNITSVGNGTLLSKHLFMYPWIAEWEAGQAYYEGSSQVAGGKRMMFMAGTQETDGVPQGDLNLTADGQQVFLNAVAYMMAYNPVPTDEIFMKHLYTFEDGTASDLVGDADGTLVGDAYIADGSMITVDQDDWMEMPGDVIAVNTYNAVTLEAWYTPAENANTSWTMLAYLGDSYNGYGSNGLFMTSARGDDVSRAAISTGNQASPWGTETGVNGPEYDDGLLHHMVLTLDTANIQLYIDGELMGTAAMTNGNSIHDISTNFAYLAKGGYSGDPEWIGAIHKYAIYNKVLSDVEVLYLYLQGE